ncbi:alpha/beta hydrolase [Salimicrobium flavidum]|uniref:Carboxylesterase n=1 Tax=Salimicrobium flavidum TaxID=570947 RepID=A0A1N7IMU1_9BACI|nr:alpha/beta fold hydrolase [Salimicrobium flavidum]SIS38408.1 carboxylesterase [Salimicrobium flavidum]
MRESVMKGAEAFYKEGNEIGIVVLHGFTGTTQSMRPLAEAYAKEGYTVVCPKLIGHGTTPEDMEQSTAEEWIQSAENAFAWLENRCNRIFVVGLSLGGTLSLYLAANKNVDGLAVINPAVNVPEMVQMAKSELRFVDSIGSDIKKKDVSELTYHKTPVRSLKHLRNLMAKVHEQLSEVKAPMIVFVSEEDHVVPPDNGQTVFDMAFSEEKELVHLENSYHVATLDNDQDLIIERCLEFFSRHVNAKVE